MKEIKVKMNKNYIISAILLFCAFTINASDCVVYSPKNGTIVTDDFYFVCQWGDNENMTIEIAKDESFSSIIISESSRWTNVEGWMQSPMPITNFGNGTYYWRIAKAGGYSDVLSFVVEGRPEVGADYEIVRDSHNYPMVSLSNGLPPLTISSMWLRSIPTNNGLNQSSKGAYNTSMVVKDGIVYIGNGNYNPVTCQLFRYNAYTGEQLETLDVQFHSHHTTPLWPMTSLVMDDDGTVAMFSRNQNSEDYIYLHTINLETGMVIREYKCERPYSSEYRNYYHFSLRGAINSGTFSVYSAVMYGSSTSSNNISSLYIWNFNEHKPTLDSPYNLNLPANKIAIYIVCPIDDENVIVDNNYTIYPQVYNLSTGKYTAELPSELLPEDYKSMGINIYNHGDVRLMGYASKATDGSKFNIVALPDGFPASLDNAKLLWTLPEQTLGNISGTNNFTCSHLVDATPSGASTPRSYLYMYSAGNGLAAYVLTHLTTTSVDDVISEKTVEFKLNGRNLLLSDFVESVELYNANGVKIKQVNNSSVIDLSDLTCGVYIAKIESLDMVYKFVLK